MAYTLKFTLAIPSVATPVDAIYISDNLITVNLLPDATGPVDISNLRAVTGPVDVSKLPLKINNINDINVSSVFPIGSVFTSITYNGPELHLYDKDGKEIIINNGIQNIKNYDKDGNEFTPFNNVTKIIAGKSSKNKDETNIGLIIGLVIMFSIPLIGFGYLAYMHFSPPKDPTYNRFNSGE
jgi:hypothetical protein